MMYKLTIKYGESFLFLAAGIYLINNGLQKTDFNSAMQMVHYRPSRKYGKGYSIALGILCVIGGLMLLTLKPR
jgi:hypothetical protein